MKLHLPKLLLTALLTAVCASASHADDSASLTLGDVMYVGDSITHGVNSASYRWALHKIFVDNEVGYTETGYQTGSYSDNANDDFTPSGDSYRGVEFTNRHSAYASQRTYETAGRADKNSLMGASNIKNWLGLSTTTNTGGTYNRQPYNPDTFFLLLGTNDLLSDYKNELTDANLAAVTNNLLGADNKSGDMGTIVDAMYQSNPKATVYVSSVPCWTLHANNNNDREHAAVATYNVSLKSWVSNYNAAHNKNIVLVDVNRGMLDVASSTPFYGVSSMFNNPGVDGLHPNAQGDLIIAGNMARAMGIAGRTAGAVRKAAENFAHVVTNDGSNLKLTPETSTLSFSWSEAETNLSPAAGFTAELMGFTFGNGEYNTWNTTDNFTFTIGNGSTLQGSLSINEAYIQWGSTILFSENMSTLRENIRMAYITGDSANGINSGFYVWLGDMLIGEALGGTETSTALNGVSISYSGTSSYTLQGVAMDSTGAYAPTYWTDPILPDGKKFIYASNTPGYMGDVWVKVDEGQATGWAAAQGNGGSTDGNITMIFEGEFKGCYDDNASAYKAGTVFGAVNSSGGVNGNVTIQLDAANAKYNSFAESNPSSIVGAYESTIAGTFKAVVNAGTFTYDILGGLHTDDPNKNGSNYIGATEIYINGGTIKGAVYGGGRVGSINGDTYVAITGGVMEGNIYAGGKGDTIKGNTCVTISGNTAVIKGDTISGGGTSGSIQGSSTVIIKNVSSENAVTDSIVTFDGTLTGGNNVTKASTLIFDNAQLTGNPKVVEFDSISLSGASNVSLGQTSLTGAASTIFIKDNSELAVTGDFTTAGGLTITGGAGSVTLSGEQNTIKGALTITEGTGLTLDADSALTVNKVIQNNGVLDIQGTVNLAGFTNKGTATLSGELNLSNLVTNEAGADLTLSGATLSLSQAIANSGKITIENPADTIIKLENLQETNVPGSIQTWSIINNADNGNLEGWDTLALSNFSLNGETLTLGDWDAYSIENGRVSLYMLYRYWDSVAGEDTATWDTDTTAVWRDNTTDEGLTYESGSRVAFGDYEDVDYINGGTGKTLLNKTVSVSGAGVTARALDIFGEDYVFQGGDVAVTDYMSIQRNARFDSSLLIGSSTKPLTINVWEGRTLTISDLKTRYTATYGIPVYEDGSFIKTGSGTLAVTNGIHGTITSAMVNEGKLELGAGVTMVVGANRLTGGSIENAVFLTTGEITRAYSQNSVTAHNIIKAADGTSNAVLADATLHVGTKDAYATLQDITFAGKSALTGYITFEHTQSTNDMAVATGGTLAVNGVSFDLHGLSGGDKVLIAIEHSLNSPDATPGSITGWETAKFLYSGVAINAAAIDTSTAGMVTIKTKHAGNLYWDGSENNVWDASTTNWSLEEGSDGENVFTALSNIYFGNTPKDAQKDINITQDVVVTNLYITQGGYSFSGSRLAALNDISLSPADGELNIGNNLIAQGNISVSGDAVIKLNGEISAGGDVLFHTTAPVTITQNVNAGGDFNIGSRDAAIIVKDDKSTLYDISGDITASNVLINIESAPGASSDNDNHLLISGKLRATGAADTEAIDGTIIINGSASKEFSNAVEADKLCINNSDAERTTYITFSGIVDVNTLEIADDSYVRISHSGSDMDNVLLGGTLYMDTVATTYNKGYNIYSTNDAAEIVFGTISNNTMSLISGLSPDAVTAENPQYHSINVNANTRFLTVNRIENLKDLILYNGPMTVQAGTGAIHGVLRIQQGAALNLNDSANDSANDIMGSGSGAIYVEQASINLNETTQTLGEANTLWLSTGTISGSAKGRGLVYSENTGTINYTGRNTISANITVNQGTTLTLNAFKQLEDLLIISGNISGNGQIEVKNDGILQLDKDNSFAGSVSLFNESILALRNSDALAQAQLILKEGSMLYAEATGSPYNVKTLTLEDGAGMQLFGIVGVDAASAKHSVLHLGTLADINSALTLNLQLVFENGELENMKTYNLFSSDTAVSLENLNIALSVIQNNLSTSVAANQYTLGYDATEKVVYLRTMLGHIWDGGISQGGDGDGIWTNDQNDINWSGKYYDESIAYNDAIFADLANTATATVSIKGSVNPGDIYFETNNTAYVLTYAKDGELAAGNNIHKAGTGEVTLSLADAILGNVDVANGELIVEKAARIQGKATIAAQGNLQAKATLSIGDYGISGLFRNMVMDEQGLTGAVAATPGIAENTVLAGSAMLNNIRFTGAGSLENVIISKGVSVAEGAQYTLSGTVTFDYTLTNAGTVNFAKDMVAELGKLAHTDTMDASGKTTYTYQLVTMNGAVTFGDGDDHYSLSKDKILLNGVNLNSGLADNVATVHSFDNGTLSICIGNITSVEGAPLTVDGSVGIPYWDARWGAATAPALTRLYTGTYAAAPVTFGAGKGTDADYYTYGSIVKNGGNDLAVTLSAAATGAIAAGRATGTEDVRETWIYDRSAIGTVVGGVYTTDAASGQRGATHLYVDVAAESDKTLIVGGSYNANQEGDSYLTIKNGTITDAVGGSYNGSQTGTARVYVDGGTIIDGDTITNLYAGGYNSSLTAVQTDNGDKQAVEMLLTGGSLSKVVGGGYNGSIDGNIYVRAEGNARITSMLVGGSQGGSVDGNIVLDLVSGSAVTVHAAGTGNASDAAGTGNASDAAGTGNASVTGNVTVNLYKDFNVTGGLYGGKENNAGVTYTTGAATLHFAEAGKYELATWKGDNAGTESDLNTEPSDYVIIQGFDTISLSDAAVVTVDTNYFDRNVNLASNALVITGNGILQLGGFDYTESQRRDIRLEKGATLKILSSYTARTHNSGANNENVPYQDYTGHSAIHVTDGTTLDITGYPRENSNNDQGGSLAYRVYLAGDGVDGKGALYKNSAAGNYSTNPVGKMAFGRIELENNASITADGNANILQIGAGNSRTNLILNEKILTKRGQAVYALRNTDITGGTIYVHEGTLRSEGKTKGVATDVVLAADSALSLEGSSERGSDTVHGILHLRSLSGQGQISLQSYNLYLTPHQEGKFYGAFLDENNAWNNLMQTTGYAYGVYSGEIQGSGSLHIGDSKNDATNIGTQYLSSENSTYNGGTHVESGRLYLLSTTIGSASKGSTEVTSGPIGTGTLYWDAAENAEVYLGNGVTVYNEGSTFVEDANSAMIIGVEGAHNGERLNLFTGINGTVTKDGIIYREVDTHNLYSISCNGIYADGSIYMANTEIDRNKMLLVKEEDWNADDSTVQGFSDTGYNEATYSGVLRGEAALVKVGAGTLVIDQANEYTGGTRIEQGTLKLKGWAQIGSAADGTVDVVQTEGATLMLAYDGSYGSDELAEIANNITLRGKGDKRWEASAETNGATAALISDVGSAVKFILSGDISGSGNLLHSGEGTLVLSGDSDFTGGMQATGGVVEVQSATGLGATANGSNKVTINAEADLHVSVEANYQDSRMTTALAVEDQEIKGDVVISGTTETERIFHMASNGYDASSTTLHDNGTLLVHGEGVSATTARLSGSGKVVVSDASGSAARADVQSMMDYSGDFVVEGDNASINVATGVFNGGSMDISGQNASVKTNADIIVATNQHLALSSTGTARGEGNTSAIVSTTGVVTVNNGAEFSVSFVEETKYDYYLYDLKDLQNSSSISEKDLTSLPNTWEQEMKYISIPIGNSALEYDSHFDSKLAVNGQAAGAVQADNGLEFTGGSTYKADKANTSLLGGTLLLNPDESSLINFTMITEGDYAAMSLQNPDLQVVLFTDVGSVFFGLDNETAVANNGIYFTQANRYLTGCPYISDDTLLVYDAYTQTVYLHYTIPEPTTATLSMLALAALAARRRRK